MFVTVGDIKIEYELSGKQNGPVIVFCNSLMSDMSLWDAQAAGFGSEYQILRYNQRGHGQSSISPTPFTFQQLADDVAALLDTLKINKIHAFVGVSMGGGVGLAFGAKHAARVDRLVICDIGWSAPPGSEAMWSERIEKVRTEKDQLVEATLGRWFNTTFVSGNKAKVDAMRQVMQRTPAEGYIGVAKLLMKADVVKEGRSITLPALLLAGANDGALPKTMAGMASEMQNATFVSIPDAGHLPCYDQPQVFNQHVKKFLA